MEEGGGWQLSTMKQGPCWPLFVLIVAGVWDVSRRVYWGRVLWRKRFGIKVQHQDTRGLDGPLCVFVVAMAGLQR